MIARSAIAKMLCSSWVTTTNVKPSDFRSVRMVRSRLAAGDRIESGRGLVEHQDVASQRHGARDAGALEHAAGELGRHQRFGVAHLDLTQQQPRRQVLFGQAEIGELVERKAHVLQHGERAEQGAALVHHAEAALQLRLFLGARR